MKFRKTAMFLLAISLIASLSVMPVSAESFTFEDFTIDVPDDFSEMPSEWPGNIYDWAIDEDIELVFISESNRDYKFIYADCSEEELEKFSTNDTGTESKKTAENVTVNGLKGMKIREETEFCTEVSYHFSTVDDYYYVIFRVYDEDYLHYIDEIISTVNIDGEIVENAFSFYADLLITVIYVAAISGVAFFAVKLKKKRKQ